MSLEHHLVGGYVRYISPHIIIIIIIKEKISLTSHLTTLSQQTFTHYSDCTNSDLMCPEVQQFHIIKNY